ncbi:MAG TPA: HlyD family efflux transporter periplasmic adaptor subunit [Xanthobacteraceae bacterium]|nr:HlyD family efflux transporter periplasmic adaptor subunit [Xanthobacteraceae bacterium]
MCFAFSVLVPLLASFPVFAHEGHDSGPSPVAASAEAPSLGGRTERFEIVARQIGDDLVVAIDAADTNAPVAGAVVSVQRDGKAVPLRQTGPGTYAGKISLLGAPGAHELAIVAATGGREDRLAGSLATVATAGGAAAPHRHPDGAVFLAKPAQHLLEVRTAVARTGEAAASREIVGRVIADPNGFGRVQALRDGRITAPDSGFPHLGQSVTQGEVLAVLVPTLSSFEEASLRERLAQVERDMAALVPRADAIGQVNPNMPMSDAAAGVLQELQIQSQGLRRQHELLKAALEQRIDIKAPVAGVIASANVTAGQVVAARDLLFEVINRSQAMVEGFSFEPAPAEEIAEASGATEDGRAVKLVYLGRGRVLQQQAVPLLFRVTEGAAMLDIGTPVRILVRVARRERGVALPRAAVQRGFGNLAVVWEHTAPETFVPHIVTTVPLDAGRVMATSGLTDGMRLVTAGAQFVNQVR